MVALSMLLLHLGLLSGVSSLSYYNYTNQASYQRILTSLSMHSVLQPVSAETSLLSCASSCTGDNDRAEFGYRDKGKGGDCLLTKHNDGFITVATALTGYTYYTLVSDTPTYCDRPSSEHSWTVVQRRFDGSVDFLRGWSEYQLGFGDTSGEFWLGNDKLYELTKYGDQELRIELVDNEGVMVAVEYGTFMVGDAASKFQLTIGDFKGCDPPGDAIIGHHNNSRFSTFDSDNDGAEYYDCAAADGGRGGWWFGFCHDSNLNGAYGSIRDQKGINWYPWHSRSYSLSATKMMIRTKRNLS